MTDLERVLVVEMPICLFLHRVPVVKLPPPSLSSLPISRVDE
jgi:hypothetical protein